MWKAPRPSPRSASPIGRIAEGKRRDGPFGNPRLAPGAYPRKFVYWRADVIERVRDLFTVFQKIRTHLVLLRKDPERFGKNILQYTNKPLFEERLVEIMNAVPMYVAPTQTTTSEPRLHILTHVWEQIDMSGGPNTIVNLAFRIARRGVKVGIVTTVSTSRMDHSWFRAHAARLLGDSDLPDVPLLTAVDSKQPLEVGPNDLFMATHWTTAQQLKPILPKQNTGQFFYLIQDFEPGFYAWSSNFALAMETYGMDFWPIFNEKLLADFMLTQPIGRLSDSETRARALVFEPAIDSTLFHPASAMRPNRARRLLFYARPTERRNMFGLGLTALRRVAGDATFDGWEFLSIGSRGSLPDLPLEGSRRLRSAPWMNYSEYAGLLRDADVLLCPMLSPHTSYPVLEMAASGRWSVTNTYAAKTRLALESLSPNIIACEPTIEGLAEGLLRAAREVNSGRECSTTLNMPRSWSESLDSVANQIAENFWKLSTAHRGKA